MKKQPVTPPTPAAPPRLIDRAWVYAVAALWALGIVAYYYGLQFRRLAGLLLPR